MSTEDAERWRAVMDEAPEAEFGRARRIVFKLIADDRYENAAWELRDLARDTTPTRYSVLCQHAAEFCDDRHIVATKQPPNL